MTYLLLLVNVFLLVGGQMLWKVGAAKIDQWNFETIIYLLKSPFFIGGGLLYVVATFIWMYIITKLPFSVAYPLQSLSYVIGVLAAYFYFKESVDASQWIGVCVIVIGVYLIAK
ncbi:EamA family transporter [Pseudalkalibacillus berkeleyi]|uniref:EamA family transporter n=1 Tax=Pseudalkalibacillus berkeleyi TaxID=1069813 RepID=A0ABS9H3Z1_9BACL|nr:EamA family transporter [Pseudalkalibacillus berkeleyi]MCF6138791.1 EamA family transporter [Pseudalkalibacillus berkeleyi]